MALTFTVEVPAGEAVRVDLRSRSWVPAEVGIGTDTRPLGVPVIGVHAGGGWRGRSPGPPPALAGQTGEPAYLDSYDRILANSRYTSAGSSGCGTGSDVLYPPVTLVQPGDKEPGDPVGGPLLPAGHRPQQEAAGDGGGVPPAGGGRGRRGWEYHLVGGCSPEHRPYLDEIRAAAEGLPVVLHPDASGAELRDLYGRASIFWHAAGLGEDPDRHPDRFEHFGITTVEAMSAGAVPVVIDAAGQVEIVEQGVSGYRFAGVDGLVAHTELLIADPAWRATLASRRPGRRAETFGWDAFVGRVRGGPRTVAG